MKVYLILCLLCYALILGSQVTSEPSAYSFQGKQQRENPILLTVSQLGRDKAEYGRMKTSVMKSISLHNKLLYCSMCQYTCVFGGQTDHVSLSTSVWSSWSARFLKVDWIRRLLAEKLKNRRNRQSPILYMDLDTLFISPRCTPLYRIGNTMKCGAKRWDLAISTDLIHQRDSAISSPPTLQTGVMVVRGSRGSRHLFELLYSMRGLVNKRENSNNGSSYEESANPGTVSLSTSYRNDMSDGLYFSRTIGIGSGDTTNPSRKEYMKKTNSGCDLKGQWSSDQLALNHLFSSGCLANGPETTEVCVLDNRVLINAFPAFTGNHGAVWRQLGRPTGDEVNDTVIVHFAGLYGGASIDDGVSDIPLVLICVSEFLKRHLHFVDRLIALDIKLHDGAVGSRDRFAHAMDVSGLTWCGVDVAASLLRGWDRELDECVDSVFSTYDDRRAEVMATDCLRGIEKKARQLLYGPCF